ncbi:prolyl oligopeptidase family serine peptidase [Gimibacter soli]|uniref:Prolyl oligopeptidase family serine peptidase n=1 Tax=Gimibacter soli TaxID=3024400 RepID=A0AAE9XRN7_9PROT|nr:prolyl oligopeptidase family serine peptidase [Gimibacter soli]WCL55027.1 prolyl oligopeptidase family serine peptidase [Gimibacter soli]
MTIARLLAATAAACLVAACEPAADTKKSETPETAAMTEATDPYLWLEEVEGEKALEWVTEKNAASAKVLDADPRYQGFVDALKADYESSDKITPASLSHGKVYELWQDDKNVRGLWRVADWASYKSGSPAWETLLDLDALAEAEHENWVWKGKSCFGDRCILNLSRGGSDATVRREFDLKAKAFVDGGFATPESKGGVTWEDADTLLVSVDFGEGTLTTSGYPRQVRRWKRGTPLDSAELVFEGSVDDVSSQAYSSHRMDGEHIGIVSAPDFFTEAHWLLVDGKPQELKLPHTIELQGYVGDWVILTLRADWAPEGASAKAGDLVALKVSDALGGTAGNSLTTIFSPSEKESINSIALGRDRILVSAIEDVKARLKVARLEGDGFALTSVDLPDNAAITSLTSDEDTDATLFTVESFLMPTTLYALDAEGGDAVATVQSLPARFDAANLVAEQHFATSKDGTKVPYFLIRPKDAPMDGTTPTLMFGYGGFEISITPQYLSGVSKLWVENGGAFAFANIRGGGEYGPAWHQAALKENRQRAYDDFIAISEDMIASGLTSTPHLGIQGRSNGGLLMGAMLTQRPDLFGAIICGVPLIDMKRYNKLLAGASWMGEYGNPDIPEEWDYISKYSPYQHIEAGKPYPEMFVYTSTKDDRVHPGHARKMTAKLESLGYPVLYYENMEGGHAGSANLPQLARREALQTVYALQKLKD